MGIGRAIKYLRSKRKISQIELAKKTAISQGFLSLIERGKREPGFDLIKKIAESLQIPEQLIFLLTCESDRQMKGYRQPLKKIALALDDILREVTA